MSRFALPVAYPDFSGHSWMTEGELARIIELIPENGQLLEIGSAEGVTAAVIAQRRPDAHILSVDPYPPAPGGGDWLESGERLKRWYANRQPNQSLWLGTAAQLLALGHLHRFPLIIVDGDHEEESVLGDLHAAYQLRTLTGLVWCHDYAMDEPDWPGVRAAVDRFCGPENGLRILERVDTSVVLGRPDGRLPRISVPPAPSTR